MEIDDLRITECLEKVQKIWNFMNIIKYEEWLYKNDITLTANWIVIFDWNDNQKYILSIIIFARPNDSVKNNLLTGQ